MVLSEAMIIGLLTVVSTGLSPVIAVCVTRIMDEKRDAKERKLEVFRTLMKTRGFRLSSEHVLALNLVEIEFYGDAEVNRAFKLYFEHLQRKIDSQMSNSEQAKFAKDREELLTKLLHVMAKSLKYLKLEQLDIMNGGYAPQGWANIEEEQQALRLLLIDTLKGNRAMPITTVVNPNATIYPPPPNQDAVKAVGESLKLVAEKKLPDKI